MERLRFYVVREKRKIGHELFLTHGNRQIQACHTQTNKIKSISTLELQRP